MNNEIPTILFLHVTFPTNITQCSAMEQGGVAIQTHVMLRRGTRLVHFGTHSTLTLTRLCSMDLSCLTLKIQMLLIHGIPSKMLLL